MRYARYSVRTWALVASLVLLAAAPLLADPPPRAAGASADVRPAVGELPAALQAPWSLRSGFVAGWPSLVSSVVPYDGNVTVSLTFWPQDLGLFRSSAGPSPALNATAFAQRFGLPEGTYATIAAFVQSHGFRVLDRFSDRLALTVEGPASSVPATFGAALASGSYEGRTVHFPESVPVLPPSLAPYVSAVSGLSEGFSRFTLPFHPVPLGTPRAAPAPAQGRTTNLVTPSSVHPLYGLDDLYNYSGTTHLATGQGIAVVLWGDGYDPSDLATFFAQYYPSEFPAPTYTGVPVDGAPPPGPGAVNDPSQAPLELTLDLEWSGSEAPGATLYAVYAPDGPASNQYSPSDVSLEDALHQAIQEANVRVVSMSFATPDGADPAFQAAFTTYLRSAVAQGITPLAASGDNGGTDNAKGACTTTPQPEFPAASPDVIAVGGTAPVLSLSLTGAVTGLDSEPAWKDSGGGFSSDYAMPSWQSFGSAGRVISPTGQRGIPDVAGPAAYNFLFFAGQAGAGNGTSFAAPLWAGIIAEMDAVHGSPLLQLAPHLYSVGQAQESNTAAIGLVDITAGSNCLGPAATGWDTATGWGSPRAGLLYQDLSGSYVSVGLVADAPSAPPGGSIAATVTVLNATTHAALVAIEVNLTLAASGYSGPCGGTLATGSGRTDANGTLVTSVSVPGCYLGSHAILTATVLQGKLFGSNSTTITINLLGFAAFLAFLQTYPYNVVAFAVIMAAATAIGLALGRRQRRRRIAELYPAATAAGGAAPAAAPPSDAAPPVPDGGATTPSATYLTEPRGVGRPPATPGAAGPTPTATIEPVGPSPAVRPEPSTKVTCATCGFPFDPRFGFCPRCGQYLTTPGGDEGPDRGG
jgi:kumamolisin